MIHPALRRLLTFAGRVPRFVTLGEPSPQNRVRVFLETAGTEPRDVTRRHLVASLKPLIVGVVVPAGEQDSGRAAASLRFAPAAAPDRSLGRVLLASENAVGADGGGGVLQLFRATGHVNYCLRGVASMLFEAHHGRFDRRGKQPPAQWINQPDQRTLQVVYTCPRPVVLVSVEHEGADNLFPMDLVTPVEGSHFLLALRSTSPSIPLMTQSRRLAIADVPFALTRTARELGVHHKKTGIDWSTLPFRSRASPAYGLRLPDQALGMRDLEVRDIHVIGSHTLFVTRVVAETGVTPGLQMMGISGSYYRYLELRGEPMALASSTP